MAQASNTGWAGCGGNSKQGGQGSGGRGRTPSGTVPCKESEVGACKDLEGHIFTIGSGNKGKDGGMLRTSMEKMATYIGTKYGNEAAQEWTSGKKIALLDPTYLQAILDRHAERVKATSDQRPSQPQTHEFKDREGSNRRRDQGQFNELHTLERDA
jgi:hypothetical protein